MERTTTLTYKKRRRYHYLLVEPFHCETGLSFTDNAETSFLTLTTDGKLSIKEKYAWDGVTGFPDFTSLMRAALVHDAFYQLMREGKVPRDRQREVDDLLVDMSIRDGWPASLHWVLRIGPRLLGHRFLKSDIIRVPSE